MDVEVTKATDMVKAKNFMTSASGATPGGGVMVEATRGTPQPRSPFNNNRTSEKYEELRRQFPIWAPLTSLAQPSLSNRELECAMLADFVSLANRE